MKKILLLAFCVLNFSLLLKGMNGAGPAETQPFALLRLAAAIVDPLGKIKQLEAQIQAATHAQPADQRKLNLVIHDCMEMVHRTSETDISIDKDSTSFQHHEVSRNLKYELFYLKLILKQANNIYCRGNQSRELFNLYRQLKDRFDNMIKRPYIQLFPSIVQSATKNRDELQAKTDLLWTANVDI